MSTQTPIASITLSASTSSVTFANIPQTYTDLVLVSNVKSTGAGDVFLQFNSDTGSNYSATILYGTGSAAGSTRESNTTRILIDYYAEIFTDWSDRIVQLQNYSNTTTYKTVLARASNAGRGVDAITGLWRNTSAITSITVSVTNALSFASGSTFNLYGISTANINTGKAIGGDNVYSDGSYWYHVFNTSGTFTPTENLTTDYVVVAGGGGGGRRWDSNEPGGGGGGAGGFRTSIGSSTLSLAATSYLITIGAGGAGGNTGNPGNGYKGSDSIFSTITSTGGGYGGGYLNSGGPGGSGGGNGRDKTTAGGAGNQGGFSPSEGNNGGTCTNGGNGTGCGGGGGAGAVGSNGNTSVAGTGGIGTFNAITNATKVGQLSSSNYYLAGGGGGTYASGGGNGAGAAGGVGGGGAGATNYNGIAGAGTSNTGGGGGGGGGDATNTSRGGAGGSGIVIIRYAV